MRLSVRAISDAHGGARLVFRMARAPIPSRLRAERVFAKSAGRIEQARWRSPRRGRQPPRPLSRPSAFQLHGNPRNARPARTAAGRGSRALAPCEDTNHRNRAQARTFADHSLTASGRRSPSEVHSPSNPAPIDHEIIELCTESRSPGRTEGRILGLDWSVPNVAKLLRSNAGTGAWDSSRAADGRRAAVNQYYIRKGSAQHLPTNVSLIFMRLAQQSCWYASLCFADADGY